MCYVKLKEKFCNTSVICTRAPTEEKDLIKDEFYDELTRTLHKLSKHCRKMIRRDFNVKLGRDRTFYPNVGGHSRHRQENNNEIQLSDFEVTNDMVLSSTLFLHTNIHK
jgi:hypothetical protein